MYIVAGTNLLTRAGGKKLYPKNKYFSKSVINSLNDGAELDALERNGRHFHAVYHAARASKPAYISFPFWVGSRNCDYHGDLSDCCLAARGRYSTVDGIDPACNHYNRKMEFTPASRVLGEVAFPNHKYFTKRELSQLPDKTKVDILLNDLSRPIHFRGVFHASKWNQPPYISFPCWGDAYDTETDVGDMCIAPRGAYSRADGVLSKNNNLAYPETIKEVDTQGRRAAKPATNKRPREESQRYAPDELGPARPSRRREPCASSAEVAEDFSDGIEPTADNADFEVPMAAAGPSLSPPAASSAPPPAVVSPPPAQDDFEMKSIFEKDLCHARAPVIRSDCDISPANTVAAARVRPDQSPLSRPLSLLGEVPALLQSIERSRSELTEFVERVKALDTICAELAESSSCALASHAESRRRVLKFVAKVAGHNLGDGGALFSPEPSELGDFGQLFNRIMHCMVDLQLASNNKTQELEAYENQLVLMKEGLQNELFNVCSSFTAGNIS